MLTKVVFGMAVWQWLLSFAIVGMGLWFVHEVTDGGDSSGHGVEMCSGSY